MNENTCTLEKEMRRALLEKLEQNGYIVEVGRSVLNGRGRPTRVFQLLR